MSFFSGTSTLLCPFTVLLLTGLVQFCATSQSLSPSQPAQPAPINLPHINPRPLVLSIQKLISAHLPQVPSPVVDRRKAVTIGGGRWLKPLTFQVPDAISNFLPASSNIFKVHDDPKNKTTAQPSSAEGARPGGQMGSNPFDNQQMMNAYDPLQLITNFDQNGFLKGASGGVGQSPFAFPPNASSPFAFDESQLANMNDPLFALPNTPSHHFSASQFQQQLGEKPFSGMPLFDAAEPEPNFNAQFEMAQQQQQQPIRQMKQQQFFQQQPDFYAPPDDRPNNYQRPMQSENGNRFVNNQVPLNNEPRYVNQASVNEARFNQPPVLSDEQPLMQQQQQQQQQHQQQPFGDGTGIDHIAEGTSYRSKENPHMFQSPPTSLNFQGDYFPQKPHRRLPPSGSGNYDYSHDHFSSNTHSGDFFSGLAESDQGTGGQGHFGGDDFGSSKSVSNHRPSMSIGYGGGPSSSSSAAASSASSSPSNYADNGKDAGHHSLHEGHSTSLRPFFVPNGHQHHHHSHHHHHSQKQNDPFLSSTERSTFYNDHFSNGGNNDNNRLSPLFGNDSKSNSGAELSAASEFFSQHLSPHLSSKSANEGASDSAANSGQKMLPGGDSLLKSSLFEAAAKQLQEQSNAAANSFSNFFNNPANSVSQFQQAAASMLSPVVVKNDVVGGGGNSGGNGGQQSASAVSGLFGSESKLLPALLSSNGVNVFPSALGQTRPVSNRIKEFFKSMLNQKY